MRLPVVYLSAIEAAVSKMIRHGGKPGEIRMHPDAIRILREFGPEHGFTPHTISVCGLTIEVFSSPEIPTGSMCWILEKTPDKDGE